MKWLLMIWFIFFAGMAEGQSIYYDALKISAFHPTILNNKILIPENEEVYQILRTYASVVDSTANLIGQSFEGNPFISVNIPRGGEAILTRNIKRSIGGIDVTNIADGLARFLIKRGREELNIAFFNQLKDFLNDKKYEECKVLFPETIDLLDKIDSYKYSAFLENLRNVFHKDLGNLIVHMNQVIDLPKYESLVHHKEIKLVLGTANIVSELSQAGKSIMPDSIIWQLAALPWDSVSRNLSNSLKLLNLISQSIRASVDTLPNQRWVSLSELNNNLFADSITLRIYFGLLYEQVSSQNITFYGILNKDMAIENSVRMDTLLARQKDHIFRLSGMVQNFSLLSYDLQNSILNYNGKKEVNTFSNDDKFTYVNKAINIINYGFTIANTFQISADLRSDIIHDEYTAVCINAIDLYKNIYSKYYSSAILNVCTILDSILPGDKNQKLIPGILKYGNFMASVVKSASPEEVQDAIEATALPAGSSSIKKNSAFNISLNAYIGGYFGRGIDQKKEIDGNNSKIGVTAPIGIDFSFGLGHFSNGSSIGALSLFGTLIDVGAIAGFRLNNDSTALNQKVTINDIFSPGGYLVYGVGLPFKGISYLPVSIGYGWQHGSQLYNKMGGKLQISDRSRWRSNWFIAIDIPLANFWTQNYSKKR
ncbi:MAG: hypothetical protein ABI266_05445 [Ginsengibacter sp.]